MVQDNNKKKKDKSHELNNEIKKDKEEKVEGEEEEKETIAVDENLLEEGLGDDHLIDPEINDLYGEGPIAELGGDEEIPDYDGKGEED